MGNGQGSRRPFPGRPVQLGSPAARNQPWREGQGNSNPRSSGVPPHLMLSLLIDSAWGAWPWGPETAPGVLLA